MKAIVYYKYGTSEDLELSEVEKPFPKDDEVLVKVFAVSINDWGLGPWLFVVFIVVLILRFRTTIIN